ncbi:MAG: selenocysteine-specific translation elongation factor [bacterium]|nr:selenocysteine-specific translation elongation factor [bacterium]
MIIGTAGHIDHGKTALILALTGIETDRLKEEKKRGMSIDLGFAHITLPGGTTAGIIDVPGHENFIRNMLAGIQGVDMALLVVAADDGIMPQTREHMDILDLLGIRKAIVVITKKDMVEQARLEEVRAEIVKTIHGRGIKGAPIVPFSAKTGEGLEEIKKLLSEAVSQYSNDKRAAYFRMPIDRCFSIKGLGTVVTGTVTSGSISEGDSVRLFPGGKDLKIRRIESYGKGSKKLFAGMRGAINLPGIESGGINRGDILSSLQFKRETGWIDASIEPAGFNEKPIKSGERVHLHIGTANMIATFYPLQAKTLQPGTKGYAALKLLRPTQIVRGERFIIRDYSAQRTLAGGIVLNPFRPKIKKNELTDYFKIWDSALNSYGDSDGNSNNEAKLLDYILTCSGGMAGIEEISENLNISPASLISKAETNASLRLWGDTLIGEEHLSNITKKTIEALDEYHKLTPSGRGLEIETLRSRIAANIPSELFKEIINSLINKGSIEKKKDTLRIKGKGTKLTPQENAAREQISQLLNQKGYQTASEAFLTEHDSGLKKALASMAREEIVIQISKENFIAQGSLEKAKQLLLAHFKNNDSISVIQFKEILETGRKGAILILEYFDRTHLTVRQGDERILMLKKL